VKSKTMLICPLRYFMRYYSRYHRPAPYPITGQCNATNVTNVSRPLIFGLISDFAILLLPIFTIARLQMSLNKKIGLAGVFSIGVIACATDMARIIELSTDTDDVVDPACTYMLLLSVSLWTLTHLSGVRRSGHLPDSLRRLGRRRHYLCLPANYRASCLQGTQAKNHGYTAAVKSIDCSYEPLSR
jgi:hypothetical protein